MKCTPEEVIQYVEEENVKFIRLAFCDVYGQQKNLSIMPGELRRAFSQGMAFDASAIAGFGGVARSDLLLRPDLSTFTVLHSGGSSLASGKRAGGADVLRHYPA